MVVSLLRPGPKTKALPPVSTTTHWVAEVQVIATGDTLPPPNSTFCGGPGGPLGCWNWYALPLVLTAAHWPAPLTGQSTPMRIPPMAAEPRMVPFCGLKVTSCPAVSTSVQAAGEEQASESGMPVVSTPTRAGLAGAAGLNV